MFVSSFRWLLICGGVMMRSAFAKTAGTAAPAAGILASQRPPGSGAPGVAPAVTGNNLSALRDGRTAVRSGAVTLRAIRTSARIEEPVTRRSRTARKLSTSLPTVLLWRKTVWK
jgi:hypothetical protein